jgi:uncharacterized protein YndB with AHSA1/START domain
MSEYGTKVSEAEVRFERLLPGPIERVWEYLTESEPRSRWLASGRMELHVGGKVELFFLHKNLAPDEAPPDAYRKVHEEGHRGFGRVTQCAPPHLVAFTWEDTEEKAASPDANEVIFALEPRGERVLLALTHRRLPSREELVNVSGGWHTHLGLLEDVLLGAKPRPFWATHAKLETEYAKRMGAR